MPVPLIVSIEVSGGVGVGSSERRVDRGLLLPFSLSEEDMVMILE